MMNRCDPTTAKKTAVLLQPAGSRRPTANRPFATMDQRLCDAFPAVQILWGLPQRTCAAFREGSGIAPGRVLCLPDIAASVSVFDRILLQPLTFFPRKQEPVIELPTEVEILHGSALVSSKVTAQTFIEVLQNRAERQQPTLLVAHGRSGSQPPEMLRLFTDLLRRCWPEAVTLTVDGPPGFEPLTTLETQIQRRGQVQLIPLMFTDGFHVQQDLLGDTAGSLKSLLPGVRIDCTPPLAQNPAVIDLWCQQIGQALKAAKVNS